MKNTEIIDITMELSSQTPEWPGDVAFDYKLSVTKEESGSVNVGQFKTSTHIGTHVDAPFHYNDDGIKIDELPLDVYRSAAQVADVRGLTKITPEDLPELEEGVTTLLLKSDTWKDRTQFPDFWPLFDPRIAEWMVEKGIRLLGVDVPSVDAETSKELPTHMSMNRNGRFILEGIVLDDVAAGVYELIALPLKIKGAEGSPVRAVLYR
ncbi:cyclase family protein [Planococcus sp. 107-1]|jgi:arylformamidase|uniref:cyclase family protein n=1 Tax=Planococcus sp. 107-1 TaxID=2908840 RepID=UPI001F17BED9|nr:cyclase family protein [Planococcus sp. 107-1]UJF27853.1 cyclase family protein [Planococcus sp. 107-1]